MDPEQYKLLQHAVREGLASTQWLFFIVSFVLAAMGVYFGAYLKKKAESIASHEDFETVLDEVTKQTEATGQIQTTLQKEVEGLKDYLERDRTVGTFMRNRIAQHLDTIFVATNGIGTLSRLVARKSWADSGTLSATERKFHAQVNSIKLNAGILVKLETISEPLYGKVAACLSPLMTAWDDLIGELLAGDPNFRKEFPNTPEFSTSRFNKVLGEFL